MLKNIAVLISGGGSNLQALIDQMDKIDARIKLVLSNKKEAYGLERAKKAGINQVYLNGKLEDYDQRLLKILKDEQIDLIVLAGYLKILDKQLVKDFEGRIINIHPSLLPSFCGDGQYGIKVHRSAYQRGVKLSGATVHFVDEGTDTGPIILQETVALDFEDRPEDIQKKVLEVEHRILAEAVKLFCQDRLVIENNRVKILKR